MERKKTLNNAFPAEDIPTAKDIADLEDDGGLLNNAVIIAALLEISTKKVCILCQGTVEPDSSHSGRSLNCCVIQRYDICVIRLLAKLLFREQDTKKDSPNARTVTQSIQKTMTG